MGTIRTQGVLFIAGLLACPWFACQRPPEAGGQKVAAQIEVMNQRIAVLSKMVEAQRNELAAIRENLAKALESPSALFREAVETMQQGVEGQSVDELYQAAGNFETMMAKFPNSDLKPQAEENIRKLRKEIEKLEAVRKEQEEAEALGDVTVQQIVKDRDKYRKKIFSRTLYCSKPASTTSLSVNGMNEIGLKSGKLLKASCCLNTNECQNAERIVLYLTPEQADQLPGDVGGEENAGFGIQLDVAALWFSGEVEPMGGPVFMIKRLSDEP